MSDKHTTFTQTASGAAMPSPIAETVRKFNNDMATNPLWKVMSAVADAVQDDADLEEDEGDDDYFRHMRTECRMGRFI